MIPRMAPGAAPGIGVVSIPRHRLQRRARRQAGTRFPARRRISVRRRQHTLRERDVDALDCVREVFGVNFDNRPDPAFEVWFLCLAFQRVQQRHQVNDVRIGFGVETRCCAWPAGRRAVQRY